MKYSRTNKELEQALIDVLESNREELTEEELEYYLSIGMYVFDKDNNNDEGKTEHNQDIQSE